MPSEHLSDGIWTRNKPAAAIRPALSLTAAETRLIVNGGWNPPYTKIGVKPWNRQSNGLPPPWLPWAWTKRCGRMTYRIFGKPCRQRSREMQQPNSIWVWCMKMDKEFVKIMYRQCSGIARLQNKGMPKPNTIWVWCITTDAACAKTMPKRSDGIGRRRIRG